MRKYIVEFIGTFFLVTTICMTVIGGLGNLAPIAIGSTLMVMVFAGGHISGAHYNPAVTIAIFLSGKLPARDILPYIIAQCAGAILASLLTGYLLAEQDLSVESVMQPEAVPALLAEFVGTFALCYVILNVATAKGTANNSFYGLAIGFTLLCMIYTFGAISAGAFNPAVALGISLSSIVDWSAIWIYLLACFAAGAVSAFVFNFVNGPEIEEAGA